jgi:hypothetical protein
VKEPTGTVCSSQQKQTPGGGILLGTNLLEMTRASYMAAQAFAGDYEITVRRLFGRPLGNRARVQIIQHLGTPKETHLLEIINLDKTAVIKFELKSGRRTELASVAPVLPKKSEAREETPTGSVSVITKLRGMAFGDYSSVTAPRGGAGTPGGQYKHLASQAAPSQAAPMTGAGGVNLTAQVKMSADRSEANLVLQPVFQAVGNRPAMSLPLIPGAGPTR